MTQKELFQRLDDLDLTRNNSIVIGSGILQTFGIRESKDIDLVVTENIYNSLKKSGKFGVSENHGREILKNEIFEIGTGWYVLGKSYTFSDFIDESIVIEGVRYITLDFLYEVKKSWLKEKDVRPKDVKDVELIEEYKKKIQ